MAVPLEGVQYGHDRDCGRCDDGRKVAPAYLLVLLDPDAVTSACYIGRQYDLALRHGREVPGGPDVYNRVAEIRDAEHAVIAFPVEVMHQGAYVRRHVRGYVGCVADLEMRQVAAPAGYGYVAGRGYV